jgi:hypothetical protein
VKQAPVAFLFSCLLFVGLVVVSCSISDGKYEYGDTGGSGGEGDGATSGRSLTAGNGTGARGALTSAGSGMGGSSTSGAGGDEGDGATSGGSLSAGNGTGAQGAMSSAGSSMGGSSTSGAGGSGASSGSGPEPSECPEQQKLCDGVCVEIDDPAYGCDPTLCDTAGCPDISGAELVCEAGQCLLGTCGAGTKECDGRCVEITDPAYGCGAATCDASTCPSQAEGGTVVCEDSACVIGSCPANYKNCDDRCVAVSDPTYGCGATTCDDTSCPAAGTGTLVCEDSTCALGTCGAGTKKCGDKCVTTDANNGCAEADRCTPCANNEACSGTPSTCQCVPTPMATACANKCGSVSDGCGGMYTCSGCTLPQTCGGGGTPNLCGCTPTSMASACSGKNCGTVPNGCGGTHACGGCTLPQTCAGAGTANVCGCTPTPMGTACDAKNCGTVPNGCGGNYTCGGCTLPQTCAGAGTPNVCGCTPSGPAAACSGKNCGTVPNGCGGTHVCGACGGSTPTCVSNMCKQCGVVGDCPAGTLACSSSGTCICRTPHTNNVIKDGGFDTASSINTWTRNSTSWSSADADGCPQSGSLVTSGTITRCFQVPKVTTTGVQYTLGVKAKGGTSNGGCLGTFHTDTNCQDGVGPDFLNLGAGHGALDWESATATSATPVGTNSIKLQCDNGDSFAIDQMWLRATGSGF